MVHHSQMPPSNLSFLASRPAMPVLAHWAVMFAVVITKWSLRHRTRKQLRYMTQEQLDDIGRDHTEARIQATLPFWRP